MYIAFKHLLFKKFLIQCCANQKKFPPANHKGDVVGSLGNWVLRNEVADYEATYINLRLEVES